MKVLLLMTNEEVEALCDETVMSPRYLEHAVREHLINVPYISEGGEPRDFNLLCSVELITV